MINKFSIIQMMETAKKREEQKTKKIELLKSNQKSYVSGLSEELIYNLQKLGFRLDQIVAAHAQYNFLEVDEALAIISRDVESGYFNHIFIAKKDKPLECQICDCSSSEHYDKRQEMPIDPSHKHKIKQFKESIAQRKKQGVESERIPFNNNIQGQEEHPIKIFEIKKNSVLDENTYNEDLCPICFSNSIKEKFFALECNHKICKSCVKNYFRINIQDGKVSHLTCLYGGCVNVYPHEVVKKFTDQDHWKMYRNLVENQEKLKFLLNNPNIIHCPYPNCDELIELNNLQMGNLLPQHFVSCYQNHRFCIRCRELEDHHDFNSCEGLNEQLLSEIKIVNKQGNYNYKQCPLCKIIIEKVEGCNHMKCSNCFHEFCWLCLQEYEEDHYAYYNFSGCPGLKYGKYTS